MNTRKTKTIALVLGFAVVLGALAIGGFCMGGSMLGGSSQAVQDDDGAGMSPSGHADPEVLPFRINEPAVYADPQVLPWRISTSD